MKNLLKDKKQTKKGFSLAEVLVSLGAIGIIVVIFFNALTIALTVSVKNAARSSIREQLSTISDLITKDIRAADQITNCAGGSTCELSLTDRTITWQICETNKLCKYENDGSGQINSFKTGTNLVIDSLNFELGFGSADFDSQLNILVTLVGSHQTEALNITNQVRQFSVSTRNYEF